MPFINEEISKNDKAKIDWKQYRSRPSALPIAPYRWTIDRKNNIFFIDIDPARCRYSTNYMLNWKGTLIQIEAFVNQVWLDPQIENGIPRCTICWNIVSVDIPESLKMHREDIFRDLKEAINTYECWFSHYRFVDKISIDMTMRSPFCNQSLENGTMSFVNEKIREEDKANIDWSQYRARPSSFVHPKSMWTINHDRNVFFVCLERAGRSGYTETYVLNWKGTIIRVEAFVTVKDTPENKFQSDVYWDVVRVEIPDFLTSQKGAILNALKEAIKARENRLGRSGLRCVFIYIR